MYGSLVLELIPATTGLMKYELNLGVNYFPDESPFLVECGRDKMCQCLWLNRSFLPQTVHIRLEPKEFIPNVKNDNVESTMSVHHSPAPRDRGTLCRPLEKSWESRWRQSRPVHQVVNHMRYPHNLCRRAQ